MLSKIIISETVVRGCLIMSCQEQFCKIFTKTSAMMSCPTDLFSQLYYERTELQVFSFGFCEIFQRDYIIEHLWAASVVSSLRIHKLIHKLLQFPPYPAKRIPLEKVHREVKICIRMKQIIQMK